MPDDKKNNKKQNANHEKVENIGCNGHSNSSKDWFFIWTTAILFPSYLYGLTIPDPMPMGSFDVFSTSIVQLVHTMWWGILIGISAVGILHHIPREFIIALLGRKSNYGGLLRAIAAGLLLDLCSHGILLVGMKLYERGASLGQLMAFLIASPWNSISLTLVMFALIGLKWTLTFILLSVVIAFLSGIIFDKLVKKGVLPKNQQRVELPMDFHFWKEMKKSISQTTFNLGFFIETARYGMKDSRVIIRWFFFGMLLASMIRALVDVETFATWFGPTILGLTLTLVAATILEVCSEGSTPIAADLMNRAQAPGNSFSFLMAGVSTDYTEIVTIREASGSWKTALFLPLVTLPQVILISWFLNQY